MLMLVSSAFVSLPAGPAPTWMGCVLFTGVDGGVTPEEMELEPPLLEPQPVPARRPKPAANSRQAFGRRGQRRRRVTAQPLLRDLAAAGRSYTPARETTGDVRWSRPRVAPHAPIAAHAGAQTSLPAGSRQNRGRAAEPCLAWWDLAR